ncbi:hypothetical protein [Qipengyuania huizhouensis]|uniref:hypothetical protein n=1 Tax=Qipengyuania huizhouensis TaxID=2867245 RepID=UPI001C888B38|nr:hypothetical protein [Qipengyuania huizhouensis]MBX7461107.1 hypothetical protein [Qipengyuania huizhouensis]
MSWWDEKAAVEQARVIDREQQFAGIAQYEDDDIRRSIVHLRQDMVYLISLHSALNKQVQTSNRRLVMLTWLIAAIAVLMALGVLL